MKSIKQVVDNAYGRVAVPILMYMLGAPLGLVLLVWFFFFRGR
jgi:hypothetical protein